MPQPLSMVCPNANILIGGAGDRPLLRHPHLAALAIESISSFSNVENFMLHLFVALLGGNEAQATNVYLALDGNGPKDAAIRGAADWAFKIESKKQDLLNAILGLAKSSRVFRDKLAHGIWGDSPDVPDALLLAAPRVTITPLKYEDVFVYKAVDFEKFIASNDRICLLGEHFRAMLTNPSEDGGAALCAALSKEPEIQNKLKNTA